VENKYILFYLFELFECEYIFARVWQGGGWAARGVWMAVGCADPTRPDPRGQRRNLPFTRPHHLLWGDGWAVRGVLIAVGWCRKLFFCVRGVSKISKNTQAMYGKELTQQ
jgi:hypothetical protein